MRRDQCHNQRMRTKLVAHVTVSRQGRIVIPAPLRKSLSLRAGSRLAARMEDGKLVLERAEDILARIQSGYARARRKGRRSATEELAEERRKEAGAEARAR